MKNLFLVQIPLLTVSLISFPSNHLKYRVREKKKNPLLLLIIPYNDSWEKVTKITMLRRRRGERKRRRRGGGGGDEFVMLQMCNQSTF